MSVDMGPPQPQALRHQPDPALGPMLSAARMRAGLGLRQAARLIGISHTYLYRLEQGARCPSTVVAEELIRALNLAGEEAELLAGTAVADHGRAHPLRESRW